jgi:hypothetical protein
LEGTRGSDVGKEAYLKGSMGTARIRFPCDLQASI